MYVDDPGKKESPDSSKMISPSCYWGLGMWCNDVRKLDPVRRMKAWERKPGSRGKEGYMVHVPPANGCTYAKEDR